MKTLREHAHKLFEHGETIRMIGELIKIIKAQSLG